LFCVRDGGEEDGEFCGEEFVLVSDLPSGWLNGERITRSVICWRNDREL
jgi:hypothetical protein